MHKWDRAHLLTAHNYAQLSSARRLKVGCIIVRDHRIISIGYNGMPPGWDNNCEQEHVNGELETRPEVIHAEANALAKLAASSESSRDSTAYITHAPCLDCAKLLASACVARVVYANTYRSEAGLDFLARSGIQIEHATDL